MGERYSQAVEACMRGGAALDAVESAEGKAASIAGIFSSRWLTRRRS